MKTVGGYFLAIVVSVILAIGSYGVFAIPILVAWVWWFSTMPKARALALAYAEEVPEEPVALKEEVVAPQTA